MSYDLLECIVCCGVDNKMKSQLQGRPVGLWGSVTLGNRSPVFLGYQVITDPAKTFRDIQWESVTQSRKIVSFRDIQWE